ncbi:MAG TPA: GAF domain-containing protein [Myxococcales bacterium]|nr:GAF domain-containing protein [Myxococcales bacterium]
MPKFEVHIPATDPRGISFTFRVDADGWTAALQAGMARLGPQGEGRGQNMLVDVQDDNSLHVTDAETGRVFQIRELSDLEAATAVIKRRQPPASPQAGFSPAAETIIESRANLPEDIRRELEQADQQDRARAAAPPPVPLVAADDDDEDTDPGLQPAATVQQMLRPKVTVPPPSGEPVTVLQRRVTPRAGAPAQAPQTGPRRPAALVSPAPRGDTPLREPTTRRGATPRTTSDLELQVVELERPIRPVTGTIGRSKAARKEEDIETVLSEIFERASEVFGYPDPTEALYFLLDLALEKVPSDAGSVLEVDEATGDLHFSAARGPKAAELLQAGLVVPFGAGISGFCAHSGVSVALSDVQKDPRYYAEISRRVAYETRSVLASPMMDGGRTFGCMQLLNRKGTPVYTSHEVGILSYLAHQAARYLSALS